MAKISVPRPGSLFPWSKFRRAREPLSKKIPAPLVLYSPSYVIKKTLKNLVYEKTWLANPNPSVHHGIPRTGGLEVHRKKIDPTTYEVRLTAHVDGPWHIYSQSSPKGGLLLTSIKFAKNPVIVINGKVKEEGEMEMYHDHVFDVDVYSYADKVDFVQLVKLKSKVKTKLTGTVEFMACTKEQCLTPEKRPFTVMLD